MPVEEHTHTEIGIFEAKTKLSEILRKVDQGERFTITVRGRAVADVVPSKMKDRERAAEAVRRLLAMPKIQGISSETVLEWIREGRK
jgi:prevent-host-death family protein